MKGEQDEHRSESDEELEREVRQGRKFSLHEAIGRLIGPGMMKGQSPVPRKQQAEVAIEEYLDRELPDAEGALRSVVLRQVRESRHLLSHYDEPLVALADYVRAELDSEYLLKELVRATDAEWGRQAGERPHFEQAGRPPDPDDPYTVESVRSTLTGLFAKLRPGAA